MPRYFFHIGNGSERPDMEGTELAGMGQVRSEAVCLTGEILRDMDGRFWGHAEWTLTVTDQTGAKCSAFGCQRTSRAERTCVADHAWLGWACQAQAREIAECG